MCHKANKAGVLGSLTFQGLGNVHLVIGFVKFIKIEYLCIFFLIQGLQTCPSFGFHKTHIWIYKTPVYIILWQFHSNFQENMILAKQPSYSLILLYAFFWGCLKRLRPLINAMISLGTKSSTQFNSHSVLVWNFSSWYPSMYPSCPITSWYSLLKCHFRGSSP